MHFNFVPCFSRFYPKPGFAVRIVKQRWLLHNPVASQCLYLYTSYVHTYGIYLSKYVLKTSNNYVSKIVHWDPCDRQLEPNWNLVTWDSSNLICARNQSSINPAIQDYSRRRLTIVHARHVSWCAQHGNNCFPLFSSYSISMTPLPVHRSVGCHRQPLKGPSNLSGAKEDKTLKQATQRKRENTVSCPNHSTSQSTSISLNRLLSLEDFSVTSRTVHTCIRSLMFRAY